MELFLYEPNASIMKTGCFDALMNGGIQVLLGSNERWNSGSGVELMTGGILVTADEKGTGKEKEPQNSHGINGCYRPEGV